MYKHFVEKTKEDEAVSGRPARPRAGAGITPGLGAGKALAEDGNSVEIWVSAPTKT